MLLQPLPVGVEPGAQDLGVVDDDDVVLVEPEPPVLDEVELPADRRGTR